MSLGERQFASRTHPGAAPSVQCCTSRESGTTNRMVTTLQHELRAVRSQPTPASERILRWILSRAGIVNVPRRAAAAGISVARGRKGRDVSQLRVRHPRKSRDGSGHDVVVHHDASPGNRPAPRRRQSAGEPRGIAHRDRAGSPLRTEAESGLPPCTCVRSGATCTPSMSEIPSMPSSPTRPTSRQACSSIGAIREMKLSVGRKTLRIRSPGLQRTRPLPQSGPREAARSVTQIE